MAKLEALTVKADETFLKIKTDQSPLFQKLART